MLEVEGGGEGDPRSSWVAAAWAVEGEGDRDT